MRHPLNIVRTARRLARETRGAALVEFAITFPFLLFVFAVIIEGSRMMWDYQSAITGVRDATRYIARVVPAEVCDDASDGIDDGDSLATFMPAVGDRAALFPPRVTVDLISSVLDCRPGSGIAYRNDPAPVVVLSATVTIDFPFAGMFALIGQSLDNVTTTITDESRIFGT